MTFSKSLAAVKKSKVINKTNNMCFVNSDCPYGIFDVFSLHERIAAVFTKKTFSGGACVLNYSCIVLTNYHMVFGLLFFKVGRGHAV